MDPSSPLYHIPSVTPDFDRLISDGERVASAVVSTKTLGRISMATLTIRILLSGILLGYGIWFSIRLRDIIHGRGVRDEDQAAEVDRYMYMHRLWVGDGKGILAMIADIWIGYLLTLMVITVAKALLKRYVEFKDQ